MAVGNEGQFVIFREDGDPHGIPLIGITLLIYLPEKRPPIHQFPAL